MPKPFDLTKTRFTFDVRVGWQTSKHSTSHTDLPVAWAALWQAREKHANTGLFPRLFVTAHIGEHGLLMEFEIDTALGEPMGLGITDPYLTDAWYHVPRKIRRELDDLAIERMREDAQARGAIFDPEYDGPMYA